MSSSSSSHSSIKHEKDYNESDTSDTYEFEKKSKCCCLNNNQMDEQKRLGAFPPLRTLGNQTFGPLCSQVVTALYSIVNSFWISHTIGPDGLTATGAVSLLEALNNAFGLYLSACVSSRISYLFGQKRKDECAQVFVDIIRISWIFSICLPIIMLNICKPITKWFGADEHIREMGFQYMIPVSGCTICYEMYQVCCGLLQSEGHSTIYGICQVCSLVMNMACFDPLFLIAFKMPIWGASLASIIASTIPMIILMILIFRGTFAVKPHPRMFCQKFSPETRSALKVGLSSLMELLSANLPDVVIQKYLGESANRIGQYNEVISAWNVLIKLYNFIICVNNALAQGLLPTASYSFGANRLRRVRTLSLHALWIGTLWNAFCEAIILPNGKALAKIWVKEDEFVHWANDFFHHSLYAVFLTMFRFASVTTLQSCKMVLTATIQSICTLLLPIPLFSTILYVTDNSDPARLVYAFIITDCATFVICSIVAIIKLRFLFRKDLPKDVVFRDEMMKNKTPDEKENYLDNEDSSNSNSSTSQSSESSTTTTTTEI